LGKRPILSPILVETGVAVDQFVTAALEVRGQVSVESKIEHQEGDLTMFTRWIGQAALLQLQTYALEFAQRHLA
jgi:hypothetical protein